MKKPGAVAPKHEQKNALEPKRVQPNEDAEDVWGAFLEGAAPVPGVATEVCYTAMQAVRTAVSVDGKAVPFVSQELVAGRSWRVTFTAVEGMMLVELGTKHALRRTCEVSTERSLFVFGTNPYLTQNVPVVPTCLHLPLLSRVTIDQVSASDGHVVMLSSAGEVFAMGSNDCGELGTGDFNTRGEMELIKVGVRVASIAARLRGSLFVDSQGSVYCAGIRLPSDKAPVFSAVPIVPSGMERHRVSSAAFVGDEVVALDVARNVVIEFGTFGRNKKPFPARVAPSFPPRVRLVACTLLYKLCITLDGQLWYAPIGNASMEACAQLPFQPANVTQMCMTRSSAYFLLANGDCFEVWLERRHRQSASHVAPQKIAERFKKIELPFQAMPRHAIVEVAVGAQHALFLAKDGSVFGTGGGSESQLGEDLSRGNAYINVDAVRPVKNCPKAFKLCATQSVSCVILGQRKTWVGEQMARMMADPADPFKDCVLYNRAKEELRIHKVILLCRCEKYVWTTSQSMDRIDCDDVSLAGLKAFAELLYTDRLSNVDSPEVALLAGKFKLWPRLQQLSRGDVLLAQEHTLEEDLASTVDKFEFLSDFAIQCDDGPLIRTHKVLIGRNPYFQTLFGSSYVEAFAGRVRMADTNHSGMFRLLRFIASSKLDELLPDECIDVLLVCNALLLPDLKQALETEVTKLLEPENCAFLFNVAVIADCASLRKCAVSLAAQEKVQHSVDYEQILDPELRKVFVDEVVTMQSWM